MYGENSIQAATSLFAGKLGIGLAGGGFVRHCFISACSRHSRNAIFCGMSKSCPASLVARSLAPTTISKLVVRLVKARKTIYQILYSAALATLGWFAMNVHLLAFDRWYLRRDRIALKDSTTPRS